MFCSDEVPFHVSHEGTATSWLFHGRNECSYFCISDTSKGNGGHQGFLPF